MHIFVCDEMGFYSSAVKTAVTKSNSENDGASFLTTTVQNSLLSTTRSPLVSKLLDIDRVLRRNGTESNSVTSEASRNSSHIRISFSKKAAEDSEEESEAVLAIKMPPPTVPVQPTPSDVEPSEPAYDCSSLTITQKLFSKAGSKNSCDVF